MIVPTVGRVVLFVPKQDDPSGFGFHAGRATAAIVCYVHSDRLVNLAVFDSNGKQFARTSVTLRQEGDPEPGGDYCEWMAYQKAVGKGEIPPAVHAQPK